jgi:hypothetical protein
MPATGMPASGMPATGMPETGMAHLLFFSSECLLALLVLYWYKSTNTDVAGGLSHARGRGT